MSAEPSTRLSVLTLNAWGIPIPVFGSADRLLRMELIADELATGKYDLVALQEIWSDNDYDMLKARCAKVLPYAHYFHSGVIGSGVCILSKHVICTALMHRYSLNGFAHHIHRGDWFGGKVVGLARVHLSRAGIVDDPNPIVVNVYTTHIHAEYDRDNDLYLSHRLVQSYELSQFIRHTSETADLSLLVGDLNLEPVDVGYRLVLENAQLKDAWVVHCEATQHDKMAVDGFTCNVNDNKYSIKEEAAPDGKRIDFVLFKHGPRTNVELVSCRPHMNKVPNREDGLCFSDHTAVLAEFVIQRSPAQTPGGHPSTLPFFGPTISHMGGVDGGGACGTALEPMLTEAVHVIDQGVRRVRTDRHIFFAAIAILVFVLIYTVDVELRFPAVALIVICVRFVLTLTIAFCLWYGLLGLRLEEKAFKAARDGMLIMINRCKDA